MNISLCGCGCGEMFSRTRPHQKFVNTKHQQAHWSKIREKTKLLLETLGEQEVDRILATIEK